MLKDVHPVLPMRDKGETKDFYLSMLGFNAFDIEDKYERYLMIWKDEVEIHFSLKEDLKPESNECSCYIRTNNVDDWYQLAKQKDLNIESELTDYPWHQREFVLRDPNHNSLIFGQGI